MSPPQSRSPLGDPERADALALSALLRASVRTLGTWSLGLSLLAVLVGVAWPPASWAAAGLWGVVLLCGLMERYFAFRLALDERLFHQLGHGHMPGLHALDTSLAHLGLRKGALPERPWSDRMRGARNLLQRHLALVLLQTAAALASLFF
ncbi:hypothetical protein KIH07_01355 [Hydrogenophaga taeniospiralis]|uniref:hypothetical protein n=1 Tax=Hydrogenophaga taeniospiralis TaxID=65656 RepID=UPI001CFA7836|nr:hypothetical protein [Hydrogenophaga taeniospiralis]MCB4362360.1 hypothetical protein [Hydrogenophaga taeniospiralis]